MNKNILNNKLITICISSVFFLLVFFSCASETTGTEAPPPPPLPLSLVDNIVDDGDSLLELKGIYAATTAMVGTTNYLFGAGWIDSGLSVFSVSTTDGKARNVFNLTNDVNNPSALTTAEVGGTTYLLMTQFGNSNTEDREGNITYSAEGDGVLVYSVDDDGSLTRTDSKNTNNFALLEDPNSITTVEVSGNTYVYVAAERGVKALQLNNGGVLVNIATGSAGGGQYKVGGATSLSTAEISGTTYLFVAGLRDNAVSVFSIGNNGAIHQNEQDWVQQVDATLECETGANLVDGSYCSNRKRPTVIPESLIFDNEDATDSIQEFHTTVLLNFPESVATAQVANKNYLFVAGATGASAGGVTTFLVADDGDLTYTNAVYSFRQDNTTRNIQPNITGAKSLATVALDGTTYLFVAGETANAVTIFSVDGNGSLAYIDALIYDASDPARVSLFNPVLLTIEEIGETTYLFVTSNFKDAVGIFRVDDIVSE